MLVKKMNVTGLPLIGRQYSNLFIDILNQVLRYAQLVCSSKYEEAVDQYVTPTKKVTRKVKFSQHYDDDVSIDSDDSTHPRKHGKQEDTNTDYMSRYYRFILGS